MTEIMKRDARDEERSLDHRHIRGQIKMIASDTVEHKLSDLRKREKDYVAAILASDRLESLGAGNYYLHRLRSAQLLPEAEWAALKFILQAFPPTSHIVEIGCGWGQLLALAATVGYSCVGVDYSADRLEGAKYLRELAEADFPGVAGRLQYLQGDFPANWDSALRRPSGENGPVVGFFSNLGLNRPEAFVESCVIECKRFDHVIMDVFRFFGDFVDLKSQNAFIEKMERFDIHYRSEIYHREGAYRFIALSVGEASTFPFPTTIAPKPAGKDDMGHGRLLDLHASRVEPVRLTVETLEAGSDSECRGQIFRLREDTTSANGHDIRMASAGQAKSGCYELIAACRPRERKKVCIILHNRWREQIRFMFDLAHGMISVERVEGDALRIRSLGGEVSANWSYFKASIEIAEDLPGVEVSLHLADDEGRYYYDGDGKSAIDVGMVTLSPM